MLPLQRGGDSRDAGVSSLHCLFLDEADAREAQAQGMMLRQDVQFHWNNPGYRDFEDFLAALSRDKRKRIRQERRKVQEAGISLQCVTGEQATAEQWAFFASCYAHTRQLHHSPPALNDEFFPAHRRRDAAAHLAGDRVARRADDRERAEYRHR